MAKQKSIFDYLECNRDDAAGDYFCPKCKRWGRKYQHKSQCHECRNEWRRRNARKPEVRAAIRKSSQEYYDREISKPEVAQRRAERAAELAVESAAREALESRRAKLRAILRRIDALICANPWYAWQRRMMQKLGHDRSESARGDRTGWKGWASNKARSERERFVFGGQKEATFDSWAEWATHCINVTIPNQRQQARMSPWKRWAATKASLLHTRFKQKEARRANQKKESI
jgi:hypothetical protein